jgi:hypothetical protein
MSLTRRALLPALAFLAVAWAQIVGLQRGYLCDCGGQETVTAWDHCDGPHGVECHDHEAAEAPHSKAQHHGPENTQDHPAVKEKLLASQSSLVKRVMVEPVVFATWAPLPQIVIASQPTITIGLIDPHRDPPRPWPAVLAHTIELRI